MTIQALGYLGIGTDRLDDWTDYATNLEDIREVGAEHREEWDGIEMEAF